MACGWQQGEAYFWAVAHDLPIDMTLPRALRLQQLVQPLQALMEGERSGWANLANAAAAVFSATGWHWVGFYVVDQKHNLVLGPFQVLHAPDCFAAKAFARPGSTRNLSRAQRPRFLGHAACSSASLSGGPSRVQCRG